MAALRTLLFSTLLGTCLAANVSFPSWFKFGAATAAYQVEGAWNVTDKGESIWDRFTHSDPTMISDLSNGDAACDSYNNWQRDVEMAAELGLQFYRFSFSWTRILPNGYSNNVSVEGTQYYSNLLDGLLAKGIEPVVTIYHWDLPQSLQDLGGWANPLVVQWFTSYSRVVFDLYADRVKTWITFNEPLMMCDIVYFTGSYAPGVTDKKFSSFLCNKHLLLAHASVWRMYDEKYKPSYHGKMSLANHLVWYKPKNSSKDQNLTELSREYMAGRYAHPIYSKEGGWPASIEKTMEELSFNEGYDISRLPKFTEEEIEFVKGTYDFFGMNYYTCRLVRDATPQDSVSVPVFDGIIDLQATMETEPNATYGASSSLSICPTGLREQLAWIKEQYGDVEILITENGYSTSGSNLSDSLRSDFIRDHMEQILLSINVDKVNVTGYTYWSLFDNFEWTDGYEVKFGLYEVDFNSTARTRTPRDSAYYYKSLIQNHSLTVDSSYDEYITKK